MKAVKGNKEYLIDESQKKTYQGMGFDIKDDAGKLIAHGRGKTVPYEDHMKAVAEIERLRSLAAEKQEEIEMLKAKIEKLEGGKKEETKKSGNAKAGD